MATSGYLCGHQRVHQLAKTGYFFMATDRPAAGLFLPVSIGLWSLSRWSLWGPHFRHDYVDGMDATHYPTRNVRDTGWRQRYSMDGTLDETAGECTGTASADSPATASSSAGFGFESRGAHHKRAGQGGERENEVLPSTLTPTRILLTDTPNSLPGHSEC